MPRRETPTWELFGEASRPGSGAGLPSLLRHDDPEMGLPYEPGTPVPAHADTHRLTASGVFQFAGATYSVVFRSEAGLLECLDTMMSLRRKPGTPRLYLEPEGYQPDGPEWPPSSLRFDFDRDHGVAAAVLLALDKHNEIHTWMTRGDAGRDDVILTHDSWNPDQRRFPPESFITIPQLRELVVQWAFGDVLPPPHAQWAVEPHDDVGWMQATPRAKVDDRRSDRGS